MIYHAHVSIDVHSPHVTCGKLWWNVAASTRCFGVLFGLVCCWCVFVSLVIRLGVLVLFGGFGGIVLYVCCLWFVLFWACLFFVFVFFWGGVILFVWFVFLLLLLFCFVLFCFLGFFGGGVGRGGGGRGVIQDNNIWIYRISYFRPPGRLAMYHTENVNVSHHTQILLPNHFMLAKFI